MEYLTVQNAILAASMVVFVASALARGIDIFTNVHPDDDLDQFASHLKRYAAKARRLLGKLALNSKEDRQ